MALQHPQTMSVEEDDLHSRYEYVDSHVSLMADATANHDIVKINLECLLAREALPDV